MKKIITLTSITKFILFFLITIYSFSVFGQENNDLTTKTASDLIFNTDASVSFGLSYTIVQPAGSKYIGDSYRGKGGMAFRSKFYIYKSVFLGTSVGYTYFKNNNELLTGNYNKTNVNSYYLFLGYKFKPIKKTTVNISTSLIGESKFKNIYSGLERAYQVDKAKVRAYEIGVNYFITKSFSLSASYIYRNDKTKIKTSNNLQAQFSHAQFSNFSLGINFHIGNKSLF